jgi:uncharacterized protein involved in outer membrane biogenesis
VSVHIWLLPLLHEQVEMGTVVLDGLQLSLETRADGKTNWEDLAAHEGAKTKPAPEAAPALIWNQKLHSCRSGVGRSQTNSGGLQVAVFVAGNGKF